MCGRLTPFWEMAFLLTVVLRLSFSAHFREMVCYDQQNCPFWHCFSLEGSGGGELGANHYLWKVWVCWGKKKRWFWFVYLFLSFVLLWLKVKKVLAAQSCPTLCDPMDCSLPGSSVQGILQARILWWVAMFFSRGSSQPRDWTQVSCIPGRFFTNWAKVHFSLLSLGAGTKFPLGIIFHLL